MAQTCKHVDERKNGCTYRQTDRQTDKQRERERETDRYILYKIVKITKYAKRRAKLRK